MPTTRTREPSSYHSGWNMTTSAIATADTPQSFDTSRPAVFTRNGWFADIRARFLRELDDRFFARIAIPIVESIASNTRKKSIDSMMQLKRSINRAKNTKPKNSL